MAVIGSATLNIVPHVVGGLAATINRELGLADVGGKGRQTGETFMDNFTKGAAIGVWTEVASKAIDVVGNSLNKATSRVDTLNNYPRIMESLGVETGDANKSIQTMSDALQNVPTRLDDMASTVSGLYAATEKYGTDLDTVTDAGLALNSMLLSGGQSAETVNAAMEQFRQMASKGKPDLQDWRSLLQAAPGQMNQLAREMLGATATTEDLYAALGGGIEMDYDGPFEWGSISMGEFVEKFADLRGKFEDEAVSAQGGIQTAFANMQNAVTRGVAGIMEGFGQESIAGAINDVKGVINAIFKPLQEAAKDAAPIIKDAWGGIKDFVRGMGDGIASVGKIVAPYASAIGGAFQLIGNAIGPLIPVISPLAGIFVAISGGLTAFNAVAGVVAPLVSNLAGSFMSLGSLAVTTAIQSGSWSAGLSAIVGGFNPLPAVIGATVGVIGAYIGKQLEAKQKTDEFYSSVRSVSSVVEDIGGSLDAGARKVGEYGESYHRAGADIEGLTKSFNEYRDKVDSIRDNASDQIGLLGQYKSVIDEMAGAGTASAGDMAKLEWALKGIEDATGKTYEATDILRGAYEDERGEVHNVIEEIDNLIETQQKQLRMDALKDMYTETYKLQAQAALELSRAEGAYYESHDKWIADYIAGGGNAATAEEAFRQSHEQLVNELGEAEDAYDAATNELGQIENMMGQAAEATANTDDKFANWVNSSQRVSTAIGDIGWNVAEMGNMLNNAGVSISDLDAIGEDNFARLASACQGNMDAMVFAVAAYNSQPIQIKEGKVVVDDAMLRDAQGAIVEWNEHGQPVDHDAKVYADGTELTDAYGNVVVWNGTELESKSTQINTDKGGIDELINLAVEFMNLPNEVQKYAHFTTTNETIHVTREIVEHSGSTYTGGGGHYAMATGGHAVPRHAGGFIAAGPTKTKYGLIGENGIEAAWQNDDGSMDVSPLNNPRYLGYARPLAESIAGTLAGLVSSGSTYVINGLSVPAESELAGYMRNVFRAAIREGRA